MSTEKNVQTVKNFFAAIGHGDKYGLLALAGTHRGHAELAAVLQKASETMETSLARAAQVEASGPA